MCELSYLGNMKQWKTIALMLGCAFVFSSFTAEHEYYVSVGEMRLNLETEQLEFALRIFSDDLEYALSQEGHPGVDILNDPEAEAWVADYVLDNFEISSADNRAIQLHFAGMEGDADAVFVYLKSEGSIIPMSIRIRHAILMDHFPDQVNILHYSNPERPSSYRFSDESDVENIDL